MINQYPTWKNIAIFLILIIGIIYTLPNLYGEDPAICITDHIPNSKNIFNNDVLNNIQQIFHNLKIVSKSMTVYTDKIIICFFCTKDQFHAYEKLNSILSKKYLISFSIQSSIPNWLSIIKAQPIKLGSDLRGGIYLILKINTNFILEKYQDQYIHTITNILNEKNIPYVKIYKKNFDKISLEFISSDTKDKAFLLISNMYPELVFNKLRSNIIEITFSSYYIHKICAHTIQQNCSILHHRINQLGISGALIRCYGSDRIIIELPGIQDIINIKKIFSTSATLEFRLVNTEIHKFNNNKQNNSVVEDFEIKSTDTGDLVSLYKQAILTGDHIINSYVSFDEYHRPKVNITLDKIGSDIISRVTKNNIGKTLATLFIEYRDSGKRDSYGNPLITKYETVISIATIQSQLNDNFCIVGINNINEAKRLSLLLRMGALPAPIYVEEERVIGPTLGQQNIKQSLIACVVGMMISILFMIIRYRYFGIIASTALIINLIFMISIMSLIPEITLTLPSIAGVILTLSVAIDSNVLINERIKEEIYQGKPIQYAIYMGYKKAFSSICDANVTTVITSVILYLISVGPIQGFSITTIIGVTTSMFTSIVGTRFIVNLIYGNKNISKLSI